MNNVLIDDRRIKVDFSQSVAKLRHQKPQLKKPKIDVKIEYEDDDEFGVFHENSENGHSGNSSSNEKYRETNKSQIEYSKNVSLSDDEEYGIVSTTKEKVDESEKRKRVESDENDEDVWE